MNIAIICMSFLLFRAVAHQMLPSQRFTKPYNPSLKPEKDQGIQTAAAAYILLIPSPISALSAYQFNPGEQKGETQ